jgi:hypothetical protein
MPNTLAAPTPQSKGRHGPPHVALSVIPNNGPAASSFASSLASTPWSSGPEVSPAVLLPSKDVEFRGVKPCRRVSTCVEQQQPVCRPQAAKVRTDGGSCVPQLAFGEPVQQLLYRGQDTRACALGQVSQEFVAVRSSDSIAIFKKLSKVLVRVQVYYEKRLYSFTTRVD